MEREPSSSNSNRMGTAGIIAVIILLVESSTAAFWGIVEFFHEGWFEPYGRYLIFYMMPFIVLFFLSIMATIKPGTTGISIIAVSSAFSIWRTIRLKSMHYGVIPSTIVMWLILALPGILLLVESTAKIKAKAAGTYHAGYGHRIKWLRIATIAAPLIIIIAAGTPLLIRNLKRIPLKSYGEVTVEGRDIKLVFAGSGPGWLYSNKNPIIFRGRSYSALSWNEIALFGKEPIGFEGKRYGQNYNGTEESIYYATQEDFDIYNMFRYINETGTELTDSLYDCWRLLTIDEYVMVFTLHGENCGGRFDYEKTRAYYIKTPDKEAPIWAPEKEVIYYWSASSYDEKRALDISYSGRVRKIYKTTKQDYRGFRAVRTQ